MTVFLDELLAAIGVAGEDLDWQRYALCAQTDPEAFYPDKGGTTQPAKRICARCPVRRKCLQYALDHDERAGIWGGLSVEERKKLGRRASRKQAA